MFLSEVVREGLTEEVACEQSLGRMQISEEECSRLGKSMCQGPEGGASSMLVCVEAVSRLRCVISSFH